MAMRAASHQGDHARCMACVQNATGWLLSRKRATAPNEGTACRLIEMCSASPAGERRCVISISRPGSCAVALVVSKSLACVVLLNSDKAVSTRYRRPDDDTLARLC